MFAMQAVLRRIFDTVLTCTYTLERNLDVPLSIAPPDSKLARLPYFALTESLTREVLKLRSELERANAAATSSREREAAAEVADSEARQGLSELRERNTELSDKCHQLGQQVHATCA